MQERDKRLYTRFKTTLFRKHGDHGKVNTYWKDANGEMEMKEMQCIVIENSDETRFDFYRGYSHDMSIALGRRGSTFTYDGVVEKAECLVDYRYMTMTLHLLE